MLTQVRLKELLDYNPETGLFIWKINSTRIHIGKLAGCNNHGYRRIKIDNKNYMASRLAWLYVYGEFPKYVIDHIDHNTMNDSIINLRDVTILGNNQNQIKASRKSILGFMGVSPISGSKKFMARINFDGKTKYLGCFETKELANSAYIEAKRILHTTCTI